MKPSIGRIVHLIVDNGLRHAPAIITHVHVDGSVNLHVFQDPSCAFELVGIPYGVFEDSTATHVNTWHWPERE